MKSFKEIIDYYCMNDNYEIDYCKNCTYELINKLCPCKIWRIISDLKTNLILEQYTKDYSLNITKKSNEFKDLMKYWIEDKKTLNKTNHCYNCSYNLINGLCPCRLNHIAISLCNLNILIDTTKEINIQNNNEIKKWIEQTRAKVIEELNK